MHDAPASTHAYTAEGLQPQTAYRIFAAASDGERYSSVARLDMITDAEPNRPLLTFVEATKTSFSYRLDTDPQTHLFHTYLEKWAYDELWESFIALQPENPDRSLFLQGVLAEFGIEAVGPQTVVWNAGDENLPREGFANITGGKRYYALAAAADPEQGVWVGTPEAVEFTVPEPDRSSATVEIELLDLQPELLESRITPDENVRFYFYHLFQKAVVDAYLAEFGQASFENHIYEYGYCTDGPYTDLWRMEPGMEYVIAVLGVDMQGDVMYADKAFTAPHHAPEVVVSLQPYENELQGYYAYESLELHVGFQNFGELSHEYATWTLTTREQVDQALAMMGEGATLEACIEQGYIYMLPIAQEWYEQVMQTGTFSHIFEQVEAETDYLFLMVSYDAEGNMVLGQDQATTPARPAAGETDPEYLAYLGAWRLEGKSTKDWSTPLAYDLTIEQLTPNRSFLVRGWSTSSIGETFPFVMNYDPATKKASVSAPQYLGTSQTGGAACEVVFAGMFVYGMTNDLSVYIAPTYKAYEVRVNDDRLSFFPELFRYDGRDYSFASLGYNAKTAEGFVRFEGAAYDPVNFQVNRSASPTAARSLGRPCGRQPLGGTSGEGFVLPDSVTEHESILPAAAKKPCGADDRPQLRRR